MVRTCSSCKYYDAGGEQTLCPKCQTPLQFTLLPPPGQSPAPLLDLPEPSAVRPKPSEAQQIGEMLAWSFRHRWVWSLVVVPVAVVLAGVFGMGGEHR